MASQAWFPPSGPTSGGQHLKPHMDLYGMGVASHRDPSSLPWRHRGDINSLHPGPSSLLPIHQKSPGVCAFFITRVNTRRVNKARRCFSPLRNGICNDTAPLMFLSQYNMSLSEDERRPVRARPWRCWVEGTRGGCLWKRCIEVGSGAERTRRILAPLGSTAWVSQDIQRLCHGCLRRYQSPVPRPRPRAGGRSVAGWVTVFRREVDRGGEGVPSSQCSRASHGPLDMQVL